MKLARAIGCLSNINLEGKNCVLLKLSTPITNKILESCQPCLTPLLRFNCLVAKPFFKTHLLMFLRKTLIYSCN